NSGGTLRFDTGARFQINNNVTLTDSGTLVVTNAGFVTAQETNNSFVEGITVASGGVLNATGTSFTRSGGSGVTAFLTVASGGHLTATGCTFAWNSFNLNNGSVLNNGTEITGNGFDTTLFVPAIDVPLLTNNLRFNAVNINGGSLLNGQDV